MVRFETMDKRKLLIALLALFFIDSGLHVMNWFEVAALSSTLLHVVRWIFIAALAYYAWISRGLTIYILFCMFLGIEVAEWAPNVAKELKVFSDIFLRLIKTIIAPLLFSTLVVGIAGHSDLKQVGRMGVKSIVYFEVVTTIALFIGLLAINVSQAGIGSSLQAQTEQVDKANKLLEQKHSHHVILDIFPENIAKSVAENQILQIVVFSILFGIALAQLKGERKDQMVHAIESLAEVMFKFTNLVMYVAPLAVGGAIGYAIATMGYGVLHDLLKLLVTLYVALIVFVILILVPIGLLVKLPFKKFLQHIIFMYLYFKLNKH